MPRTTTPVDFAALFDGLGTAEMRYGTGATALDGELVEIAGVLAPTHREGPPFLLTDTVGGCPDCSPLPVPAIVLSGLARLPEGVTPGLTRIVVHGRLRFGFEIDHDGNASFLRVENPSLG